jgi:hypothetical protein
MTYPQIDPCPRCGFPRCGGPCPQCDGTRTIPPQPEATPPHRDGDSGSAALAKSSASSPTPAVEVSLTEALRPLYEDADDLGIRSDLEALERSIAAAREADRAALEAARALARRRGEALRDLLEMHERVEAGFPQHVEFRFAVRDAARAALSDERESEGGGDR